MRLLAKTLLALALIACVPAFAEEQPPGRVGRVSLISGTLAFYGSGETDWSAAKLNYPVAAGEWFATDPQSRAEFRIGADTIDIAGDTQLDIVDLGDHSTQIGLTQGRIALNLRQLSGDQSAEIDIPRGGIWLLQPGIYDIEVGTADQPARIMVFEGSARFAGGGADLIIKAGDGVVLSGGDPVSATVERAAADAFVKWCRSRDYDEDRLAAPYHVSPGMTGFEELNAYGGWDSVPRYGTVWYPNSVAADWAPYRDGQWVWIEPWGWNWVDAEPWGFAPFHYGRWARIDDRWGWVPGNFVPQPVYAPALVAFIEAPEIGAPAPAEAGPAVGWFPLAPGEVYWPGYTRDPAYIGNVNIANVGAARIAEITRTVTAQRAADPPPRIADQQFANRYAATVVPARVFTNSGRVAPAVLAVPPQALQRAPVSVRPPQVTPAAARPAPAASVASAPPTPGHPPGVPNFHALAAAPSGPHGRSQIARQPGPAAPGAPPPGHPPGPPNFSHLAPATGTRGQPPATQPPAQTASPTPTPVHPPGPPNFSHLAAAPANQRHFAKPGQAAQGTVPPSGGVPPLPAAQAPPPQHAAQQAAAQQQAQQHAAQQAAAQQQAQQRAAQQAAAQQQAQQRAAQPAAAQQQAQQHAAQQAAAQQQAQQHAAQQAAAQQQAQQHAVQQAAAQQVQRGPRQAAAQQQAQGHTNCGHPGQPGCPR